MNSTKLFLASVIFIGLTGCKKDADETVASPAIPATKAASMPDVGGVEHIKVTTTATAPSLPAAIDLAIKLAIEQVNGKTMESTSITFQGGFESSAKYHGQAQASTDEDSASVTVDADETVSAKSSGFADFVRTQSKGAVSDFKLLSQSKSLLDKNYTVTIEANVTKYKRAESASRMRIVVAPLRVGNTIFIIDNKKLDGLEIGSELHQSITDALTNTQRVTILDREANEAADAEMDLIVSGKASNEDFARLGQQLPADFLWVATLDAYEYKRHERELRTSNRTLISYSGTAKLSHRLVNVATRQIILSDSVQVNLPETEPTTMGTGIDPDKMIADINKNLTEKALRQIMDRLFPITVLNRSGNDVVLSQGQASLKIGERYRVVRLGDEVTDPQTGQKLGRMEKNCCVVTIDRAEDKLSYGSLSEINIQLSEKLEAGELVIRDNLGERKSQTTDVPQQIDIKTTPVDKTTFAHPQKPTTETVVKTEKEDKNW